MTTNIPEVTDMQPLSAYKIYRAFHAQLEQCNTYPLTPEAFVVQQDAFARLADNENGEIFAELSSARKERDESFRFTLQFANTAFRLDVEGLSTWEMPYEAVGPTEHEVAAQLFAALQMFASGQLCVLHTGRQGRLCAVELLYRESPHGQPKPMSIEHMDYPASLRADNEEDYEAHVLRNTYDLPYIVVPDDLFLFPTLPDGTRVRINRVFPGKTITPLSKKAHALIVNDITNQIAGVKSDKDLGNKLLSSWEYWLVAVAIWVMITLLVPGASSLVAGIGTVALTPFVAGYVVLSLLRLKRQWRTTNPDYWYLRFDESIYRGLHRIFSVHTASRVLALFTACSLTFPIYVTNDAQAVVSFVQLIAHGVLIAVLPIIGVLAACILAFSKDYARQAIGLIIGGVSVAGIILVNYLATDTSERISTPEPWSSLAILTYLAYIVVTAVVLVRLYLIGRKTQK